MRIHLSKACRTPAFKDRRVLLRITGRAAEMVREINSSPALESGTLNIVLAPRTMIRQLNEEFLGHVGDTDVIAFDYTDGERLPDEAEASGEEEAVSGELYVCLPVAADAACEHGTSVSFEVLLYIVHGLLHLAGFNDHSEPDRRRMRQRENQVMSAIEAEFGEADVFYS